MTQGATHRRFIKPLIITAAVIIALGLLFPVTLAIISTPRVTNALLTHYVPQFLRADVQVEKVRLRLITTYPDIELELRRPIVRVSVPDSIHLAGSYLPFPHSDTLLAADTIRVRIEPWELLNRQVHIRSVLLSRPLLFLTQYDSTANYDIFIPNEEPDTIPSAPIVFKWEDVCLAQGTVCFASDSLGIHRITADSIYVASHGQYADSSLAAYLDAHFRCEDARMEAKGFVSDSLDIQAHLNIPHIEHLLALMPETIRQKTIKQSELRGRIEVDAAAQGYYSDKHLPRMHAFLLIDSLHGGNPNTTAKLENLTLRAEARYNPLNKDSSFIRVDTLQFHSGKSWLSAHGQACYRKQREWLQLDLQSNLHLKELVQLADMEKRVRVRGRVQADISTYFFLDDLMQQRIYDIHSSSTLHGDDVFLGIPEARLRFAVDSLRAEVKTNIARKSRRTGKMDTALLNMQVAFRQMTVKYRRSTNASIDRTMMRIYADDLNDRTPPVLHASLSLQEVQAQQYDTIRLKAKRLRVSAGMRPDKDAAFVPTTTARISMDSVFLATPRNGTMLDSLRLNLSTTPRYRRFRFNRETKERIPIPDSEHQPMALDSLMRLVSRVTQDSTPMESFIKRFRTSGKIYVRRMGVRHKGDNLRPTVSRMDLTLNDDTIRLNSFRLRVGRSAISLKGEVQHLRRYLLRGKTLDADLSLHSRRLDLNQLANALAQQQRNKQRLDSIAAAENMALLADTLMAKDMPGDTIATDTLKNQLFVLPSNLNITFRASVDTIIFSKMRLHEFKGNVRLQENTLSVTNMSSSTKVGKMGMSLRYTCRDTTEAITAASLRMDSVQVGELVNAIPEIDSLMPMLRSFDGSVASEVAAQMKFNTDMSIDLPSVNAGIWLKGQNLVLMDGETFSEIAKMLMFSKKTRNVIDSLSVELLVKNNEVEIFPFMLSMDKYRVGVGGRQNLDGSFNYHISVFKPIQLGLDVFGDNFDNVRFKLVKSKYQSASSKIGKGGTLLRQQDANVIPNLQNSIRSYIGELKEK